MLTADFNDGVCPYCGKELAATVTKEVSGSTETKGFTELKEALAIAYGGTVKLMNDVDAGKGVEIWNDVTFDLNDKKIYSDEAIGSCILSVINAEVNVKNGTIEATGNGMGAIEANGTDTNLTLEDLTVRIASSSNGGVQAKGRATVIIKSGDYQGLYKSYANVKLEGGTFRPFKESIIREPARSIFWQVNSSTDVTSGDCTELLAEGYGYVDENGQPVRTFGGFDAVVTVKKGALVDTPVAKIGGTEYLTLWKAMNAVQNGETITLLSDLDLGNGAVLLLEATGKSFTIDLDGHTMSANGAYLVFMMHYDGHLTLKNGKLDGSDCSSTYYGAIGVASSKSTLTLENVTAVSGKPDKTAVPVVGAINGKVEIDGGSYTGGVLISGNGNAVLKDGAFENGQNNYSIKTTASGKPLSDYLEVGSLFYKAGEPLDLSGTAEISDTVSVRECEHVWEDGVCTICRKVCGHAEEDGSMASADCSICGLEDVAVAEVNTSPVKYFADLDKAIECAGNTAGTVKLRKSVSSGVVTIEKAIILDLNGCDISELLVKAEAKLMNSGASNGKIGKLTISSDIALTLGDLPEEGYSFKYDNGNWMNNGWGKEASSVSVLEAPITRVWLNAENADYEQVPTTMIYGTTGSVTLNPGCVQPNGADIAKGVLWEIKGGTMEQVPERFPYTLPADLPAGEHTYRVIFTSEKYSKSADITIVVEPVRLSDVTVTVTDLIYNGTEQTPTVTVKNGETVLEKDKDYTLSGDFSATDAGSYKLIVTGDGNNFVGTVEKTWKLAPMKLNGIRKVENISKTYDGTPYVELLKSALTFFDENYNPTTIPDDVYEITDARFMRRLEDNKTYVDSPEAGGGKTIVFTVTLTSDNYVLVEHEYNNGIRTEIEKKSAEYYFATSDENDFRINQAEVSEEAVGELTITNGLAETYPLKLSDLLPELDSPRDYGTVEYGRPETNLGVGSFVTEVNSKTDALTLEVVNRSGTDEGQFGTIKIPVTTENYKPFTLTINVSAVNKLFPLVDGTVSATGLTYGQTLGESVIFGEMKDPDTGAPVYGRFVWLTDGETKLAVGSYTFDWKFIPDASDKYAPVTGKAAVNVAPRAVIVSGITAGDKIYDGKTDAVLDLSGVKLDGVLEGDELTITATGIFRSKDADDSKAGVVDLSDLVFCGKSADSYVIDATDSQSTTTAFIRRAELTVTPDTLSKTYGVSDPELTFSVAGAVGDEQPAFTGALGRAAGEDVGTYAVTSGTLKLKDNGGFRAGNYKLVFSADTVNFTINRASRADETVTVEAKHNTSGRVDLSGYIVPGGALTFNKTDDFSSILKGAPTLDGGVMSFALTENIGRARVDFTVTSTNYTDYHIIVAISSTEKDAQAVLTVVGADSVTYKNMLTLNVSGGSGTGAVTYTVENATGEATIYGNVLTATRGGTVIVIATKAGDDNYNAVTSAPFVITITKAVPTGEPEYTPITSGGMTLADARLTTEGGTFSVSGTVRWVDENGVGLDEDTIVRANKAYKWEFTPDDTVNYTAISGSITLYHAYEGGGIYISRHTIRAIAGANGSISPSGNVSVTEGRDRTFTITPDDGYAISDVRVDGRSVGAVESYTFQSVRTAHTIEADFVKVEEPAMNIFEDVPEDSYYAEAVDWAVANGVTNGVDSTHFSPDSVCTRAQAVTFLWRAAGCPKPESTDMPFTDVPVGSYYYDAVLWAVENGIANGTGGSEFAPDATCTRAHIVTFLWRSESSPAVEGDETFIDVPSDAYYYDAVLWAVSEKVTNGTGNGSFSPDADCTRAQIVTFLWRLWN